MHSLITTTALCRATELRARRLIDTPINPEVTRDLAAIRELHRELTGLLQEYDPETRIELTESGRQAATGDEHRELVEAQERIIRYPEHDLPQPGELSGLAERLPAGHPATGHTHAAAGALSRYQDDGSGQHLSSASAELSRAITELSRSNGSRRGA